jgi:cold shock CspA family protein
MKDQILASYLTTFRDQFQLADLDEPDAFEHFVNHCLISKHHPDPFDPGDVTIGASGDMGLDGVGILVNEHLVFEKAAIDYLKRQLRRFDVDFIFVQSKTSTHFEAAEIGTFISGVRHFFEPTLPATANNDVLELHKLKTHIFSSSIDMDRNPACRLYYATTGAWTNDPHLVARIDQGIDDLRKTGLFSSVDFRPIDSEGLRRAYRELHNKIVREFVFEKHTILPTIAGVQEAYIGIVPCIEYLRLLYDDDKTTLNGRLFYDNVRDFQGHNPVNSEIKETITNSNTNDRFALLNNGVTIVARDVNKVGASFRLKDYQIVNGCQTSHLLFLNREYLNERVFLPLKLIVTADAEVTNQIIQGTNRQTEVKLEAFESLTPFQKKLEELYLAIGRNRPEPIYYERRSKQYDHLDVAKERIATLPTQISCFVAMFLNEPHSTHRYYGELLSSYRNRLFNEAHSPLPYFVAAVALATLERLFSRGRLPKLLKPLKYQLLMVFRAQEGNGELPPLHSKAVEQYCNDLLRILDDDSMSETAFLRAGLVLDSVRTRLEPWREPPQRTRLFTEELLQATPRKHGPARKESGVRSGRVKWFSDVKGYGFIEGDNGTEVFVHQSVVVASGGLSLLTGQRVNFTTVREPRGLKAVAIFYD